MFSCIIFLRLVEWLARMKLRRPLMGPAAATSDAAVSIMRCRQANKDMYGKCLVNEKDSYYSCSGHHADTTRICPCRHGKAQKTSFWNFARPQRGLLEEAGSVQEWGRPRLHN